MTRIVHIAAAGLTLLASAAFAQAPTPGTAPTVQNGSLVSIEYTLKNDGGEVLDTNKGSVPLTFTRVSSRSFPDSSGR